MPIFTDAETEVQKYEITCLRTDSPGSKLAAQSIHLSKSHACAKPSAHIDVHDSPHPMPVCFCLLLDSLKWGVWGAWVRHLRLAVVGASSWGRRWVSRGCRASRKRV